jgi:cation:H+ antiporter
MPAWFIFLLSSGVVAAAGIRLARDGDDIADATGLGGLWVGAILVAGATSLPELSTDISAVHQGNPGLAVGDLFGSSMANLAILAVADLAVRKTRILTRVAINQTLVGVLAICLTAIAAAGIVAPTEESILGVAWPAAAIGFAYIVGMRVLNDNRPAPPFRTPEQIAAARKVARPLRRSLAGFAVSALVILLAAPFLASSAASVAEQLGVSSGFVGLLLLAITTSLPEVAVSLEAVRARSYDLAVGNLLGSNCFNMAALVVLDMVDGPGSLLGRADTTLLLGALFGMLMCGIALLDILNKAEKRSWAVEPAPAFMLLTYLVGLFLSYRASL